jgi:AmmeMemoRadiSam system protein B/AmmeMemoRadiSam system protein A
MVKSLLVRPPAVAGTFYPADPETLRREVQLYLASACPRKLAGELRAILVPHAGYVYSGPVAAEAFLQLTGNWGTVVLLGPAHRESVRGASVWLEGSFSTPLGEVPIDESLAREILEASDLFEDSRSPHMAEHSLEVELPFLQETLKTFRIVPVLMNTHRLDKCRQIGQALGKILAERKTLLVISSDMSHYPDRETARWADATSLLALKHMDPEFLKMTSEILLEHGDKELRCTFCGEAALLAGLEAVKALRANKIELLKYANSADVPEGDPKRVVGYAAAAFLKSDPSPHAALGPLPFGRGEGEGEGLSEAAGRELLRAARISIKGGWQKRALQLLPLSDTPELNLPLNVFVTLWLDGELQGCIGSIQPRETLLEAVRRLARDSAFGDPRGKSMTMADVERLKIDISVLSPFRRVPDAGSIEKGKHGVLLSKGSHHGLFLPDVWEHFATKEEFLDALCEQKMGLPRQAWHDRDMLFETFTTQKIDNVTCEGP